MNAARASRSASAKPKTPKAVTSSALSAPEPATSNAAEGPDPVPEGVRQLLEVFEGPLSEVSFPDVDAVALQAGCATLREADAAVHAAFAALEAAQLELANELSNLQRLAERGLAYAKVFAAEDQAMLERLAEVELGGSKKGPRKGKAKMIPKAERAAAKRAKTEPVVVPPLDDGEEPVDEKKTA